MAKPEDYITYIQFVKPQDVHDPDFHGRNQRSDKNLKSVSVKVPERISETWFCSLLVPEENILDMKPTKQAKHITWVELAFKAYKKSETGELIPNDVKIRVKKNGSYETLIMSLNEFRDLHLEAMHRLPKNKKKKVG